jgi:hypothetical protein
MKLLSNLVAASFLVVTATAVAAPVAQPQCDDHGKKGETKEDKKDDKDKKGGQGDKSGDTKPKPPAFY